MHIHTQHICVYKYVSREIKERERVRVREQKQTDIANRYLFTYLSPLRSIHELQQRERQREREKLKSKEQRENVLEIVFFLDFCFFWDDMALYALAFTLWMMKESSQEEEEEEEKKPAK